MENEIKKLTIHNALTCTLDESMESIANKLKEKKERRIFVNDKDGKLLGIITTTDLVYKGLCFGSKCVKMTAMDIMTKEVRSVDLNDDFEKALEIMNSIKSFTCP